MINLAKREQKGGTRVDQLTKWLAPLLGVVGIALAIALGDNLGWRVLAYAEDMPVEAGKVAGALFVVAVFLERALAVLNDLLFAEKTVDLETKLSVTAAETGSLDSTDVIEAEWNLLALEETKQRLRLGVGFVVACLIAGAGVRTFTGLLDLSGLTGNQRTLLNIMDILLTAGLLAGGSNGLAKIIDIFRKRVDGARLRAFWEALAKGPSQNGSRRRRAGLGHLHTSPRSSALTGRRSGDAFGDADPAILLGNDGHNGSPEPAGDPRMLFTLKDLDLAENAKGAAAKLKKDFPSAIFTSGRRTVSEQASAMAGNIVQNRQWIVQTYAASTEAETLQAWVDANPQATTKAAIASGLAAIMDRWTDAQRIKLSRHFAGLAFDVQPTSDSKLKDAIRGLPNLVKFLESEGGLTIWHAEFSAA